MLFEENRHARAYPTVSMPRGSSALLRLKSLAEDAREQVFLADENLPDTKIARRHCGHAGIIIGQLIDDIKAIARKPV